LPYSHHADADRELGALQTKISQMRISICGDLALTKMLDDPEPPVDPRSRQRGAAAVIP
jgi:hypothetical protein